MSIESNPEILGVPLVGQPCKDGRIYFADTKVTYIWVRRIGNFVVRIEVFDTDTCLGLLYDATRPEKTGHRKVYPSVEDATNDLTGRLAALLAPLKVALSNIELSELARYGDSPWTLEEK